jgi:enoyl-CoA hydratase/carnithine racemase
MADYTDVRVSVTDRVAVLTIDRPPVNALSRATLSDLDRALDTLFADEQVKVIVITGAGEKAFAGGADIRELVALSGQGEAREFILRGQALFDKIEVCSKPIIAAVSGVALGGGLELALACHIRILSENARVGQTESNLGIVPGWGGTQRLPRLVGPGRALELILTGDIIDAQEAFRLGLANKVVPVGQALAEALALAHRLASKSKLTNQATLRAVMHGLGRPLADGLQHEAEQFIALIGTQDSTEGLAAFLQKRQPEFTDN